MPKYRVSPPLPLFRQLAVLGCVTGARRISVSELAQNGPPTPTHRQTGTVLLDTGFKRRGVQVPP